MMVSPLRVLYVDDEPDLLEIGRLFLEESGDFTVTTSMSAPEALRMLEQEKFDAIISDYQMPGMDGIQFLVEVRTRFGQIPFILFTGRGREEIVIQAINSGADFYLQKGGDPGAQFAELSHKVRQAISRFNAEKQIKQSEEKFSTAFTISPDPLAITDLKSGTIINANPAFSAWSGYSSDELIGKTTKELDFWTNTHDRDEIVTALQAHENILDKAIELRIKNGDIRNCQFSARILSIDGNDYLFTRSRDITDQILASQVLQQSEERFRAIFANQQNGIVIIDPSDHRIVDVNPYISNLVGLPKEQIVGKVCHVFICPAQWGKCPITDLGQCVDNSERVLIAADGRKIPIIKTVVPIEFGQKNYLIENIHDITESKKAEDTLRESEARYRLISENTADVIWTLDYKTGKFTYVSPSVQKLRGYTPEEVLNQTIAEALTTDSMEAVARLIQESISKRKPGDTSRIITTNLVDQPCKDGSVVSTEVVSTIVFDEQGHPVEIIGISRNITERKLAEAALQHQSATLSILNGIISTANKADDLPQLLSSILEESLHLLDFDGGGIYLVDRSTRIAHIAHSKNLPEEFLAEIQPLPIDKKPYDTLFIKNEPIITENYAQFAPDRSKKYGFQSMASIPLLSKGVAIGALNVISKRRQVISEEEKQTLISISRELGSTIERMAAEEEVKKSAKNLETLFNSIDEMVFVLDMQGNILTVNDAVQKRLSYTSEELIGKNVLLLHVPERRDEALKIVQEMIAGTINSCPVPVLAKDGTRIEVETKVTHGWWNGNEALIGVSRDITERKRAEAALQESEERYHSLYVDSKDAIMILLPERGFIAANPATIQLFAFQDEQNFIACSPASVSPEYQPDGVLSTIKSQEMMRLALEKGSHFFEWTHRKLDGTNFPATVLLSRLGSSGTQLLQATVRDITERKLAEATLQESEEKYRQLFELEADAILLVDKETGNLIEANRVAESLYGYSREEFLRMKNTELSAEPDETRRATQDAQTHIPVRYHRKKDGTIFPVEITVNILHWQGRQVHLAAIRDITERKRAENALRESHDRFEATIASLDDAVFLVDPATRLILECNDATTRIFGYSREELVGRGTGFLHVDQAHLEQFGREAGATYEDPGYYTRDFEMRRKDGCVFPTEHFVRPIHDPDGRILYVVSVVRDITERKRAEETLVDSEARYRTLVEHIPQKIFMKDLNFRYVSINENFAHDLGIHPEEIVGKSDADLFPAKLAAKYRADDVRIIETGQTEEFEERYLNEGVETWVHTIKTVVRDKNGETSGVCGVFWDITERKRAENTLQRVNQKLNVLSQLTRKDLDNQIFVLNSYLELAKHQLAGQDHIIETVQKGVQAIQSIHETIEYSKDYQDMGAKPPKWQNVKMALLFGLSHISIGNIQHSLETENLEIFADPLLEKVCQRLFENSVKHGGHVTWIRVWHTITPEGATIFFEDDGFGISAENKEQIFLRGEGTGRASMRSLIFVREILDITGIMIKECGEPGTGARFEMTVPKGAWRIREFR